MLSLTGAMGGLVCNISFSLPLSVSLTSVSTEPAESPPLLPFACMGRFLRSRSQGVSSVLMSLDSSETGR